MTFQSSDLKHMYDLRNKEKSLTDFYFQTLNKSLRMFSYKNLPVPELEFEKQLQTAGYTVVFKYNDKIYCKPAALKGQEKSPYNEPTIATVAIPALDLYKDYDLDREAVLVKNDFLQIGLNPIILSKGTQIIENRLTMYIKDVLSRAPFTITAQSDKSIQSAQMFINRLIDGEMAVIGEDTFLKDVSVDSLNQSGQSQLSDLINYQTYLYGQLYNEIGLPSLSNEKKERLLASEVEGQQSTIRPLVDNMLECRKTGVEKMNKLFNGNVQVELDSVWNDVKTERQANAATTKTDENTNEQEKKNEHEPVKPNESGDKSDL